jgi:hypothetical protein
VWTFEHVLQVRARLAVCQVKKEETLEMKVLEARLDFYDEPFMPYCSLLGGLFYD